MTIKEFAGLCNCNPQTLRYYDKEELLKPSEVDSWTGYRHYREEQALDFVKIKNLQEADFSIKEIKDLLQKSDEAIYRAFDQKIQEQIAKLEKIRKIQTTYLSEKQQMETKIREIKEKVLASAKEYEPQEEFGISGERYDKMIGNISELFENSLKSMESMNVDFSDVDFSDVESSISKNVREEEEYLRPLENEKYVILYEKHDWEKTKEVLADFPKLEDGEYMLHYEVEKSKTENMAFCSVNLGYVLEENPGKVLQLGCNVTKSKDNKNHFWLLKAK